MPPRPKARLFARRAPRKNNERMPPDRFHKEKEEEECAGQGAAL